MKKTLYAVLLIVIGLSAIQSGNAFYRPLPSFVKDTVNRFVFQNLNTAFPHNNFHVVVCFIDFPLSGDVT